MGLPFIYEDQIRLQFRRVIHKRKCSNATLDPDPSAALRPALAGDEAVVVKVDCSDGGCFWFTSVRLLRESGSEVSELFSYSDVCDAGWMFRSREKMIQSMSAPNWPEIKTSNFDRIELELSDGSEVVLCGLGQAYPAAFNFFWRLHSKATTKQMAGVSNA